MSFLAPIDIKNRALDHCGQDPINPAIELTDGKKGRLTARVYDKLRKAELQRNVWEFSIKNCVLRAIDADTMILSPALWSSFPTYFVGSIVADQTGQLWISQIPDNLNNQPEQSTTWAQYYGPMTVSLYDSTIAYFAGELVYTTAGDGTNRVFLSLENANEDNPATATAWSATATYRKNQVVTQSSVAYMSRIDLNINNTPSAATSASDWNSATVYAIGNIVTASDGLTYTSLQNANVNNNPLFTPLFWLSSGVLTPWTTSFVGGTGSLKWLQVGGTEFPFGVTLTTPNIIYPVGSGPSSQSSLRNVFRLPAGFLRKAPSDPKAGATSYLGAAWGLRYMDWNFRGKYITSVQSDPIMLWFGADTVDVTEMDTMFCEMLAARIGLEVCEPITQSNSKIKTIADIYNKFGAEARLVNAILVGSEEPPLDDYLACRA